MGFSKYSFEYHNWGIGVISNYQDKFKYLLQKICLLAGLRFKVWGLQDFHSALNGFHKV